MKPYLLIIFLIALISCKDEPSSPVISTPCEGKHPVSADFDMYESVGGLDRLKADNDTMSYNKYLVLKPKYEAEYYEWQLQGDTTKYHTKNCVMEFEKPLGKIWVRLITKNKVDSACFPDDDGIDTVYKNIAIVSMKNCKIIGKFKGVNLNKPLDSFEIEIRIHQYAVNTLSYQLQNFPRGYYDTTYDKYSSQWYLLTYYNAIYITNIGTLPLPEGWIIYDPKTDRLRIDYTLKDFTSTDPFKKVSYVFEGRRIGDSK